MLRVDGFQFRFYSDDHEPAHVHVRYADTTCIVSLVDLSVRRGYNMKPKDMARAVEIVEENQMFLKQAWDDFAALRDTE